MKKYFTKAVFAVVFLASFFVISPTMAITPSIVTTGGVVSYLPVSCVINSFTATTPTINYGNSTTLSWSTTNCSSVSISGGTMSGAKALSGSINTGVLTNTVTYTLSASGIGSSSTSSTTVTVVMPSTCSITSFSATPSSVSYGGSSNLTWTTSNCNNVSISGGTVSGSKALNGSINTGILTNTTSYNLIANGSSNSTSQTVVVTVTPPANCTINSFSANPASILYGNSTTLSWNTSNCTNVSISGGTLSGSKPLSGSINTGILSGNTTFTLSASGLNYVSQAVTVNVAPPSSCVINSFTATPTNVTYGGSSTLSWNTTNCTSVSITGGTMSGTKPVSGSVNTGVLTNTTIYNLTASNSAGTVSQPVTVNVSSLSSCAINSFTATPASINYGSSAVLSWATSNCNSVTITGGTLSGAQALSGNISTGVLSNTTTYVISAIGNPASAGAISRQVTVTVLPPTSCVINSFFATPSSVSYGGNSILSWSTTGCNRTKIVGGTITGNGNVSGSVNTGILSNTTSYTLTAIGANNTDQMVATVTVGGSQSGCSIGSFYATPSQIDSGLSSTLSWATFNCTSVSISGGTLFSSEPVSGTTSTGALTNSTTYTLTASSPDTGAITRSVTVYVNQPAQPGSSNCTINAFYANPSEILSGNTSGLYWATSNCTNVTIYGGNIYSNQPASGYLSTGVLNYTTTYTITASGSNYVTQTATVYVNQGGASSSYCFINNFYAAPAQVTSGGTTTLYWSTTGCSNVTISGNVVGNNNNTSNSQGLVSSVVTGSIYDTSKFTLFAYGLNGATTTQTITVSPTTTGGGQSCAVNSFYATPSTVAVGGNTTLYWSTTGASSVAISGPSISSQLSSGSINTGAISNPSTYTVTINCGGTNSSQSIVVGLQSQASIVPVTTVATKVHTSSARLNGIIPQSSLGYVSAYFEYGTTQSLGWQTNAQSVPTTTLMNYYDTISTVAGTSYYYRAVAVANGVTYHGDTTSFTTPETDAAPIVVEKVTHGVGNGTPLASLSISTQNYAVVAGDTIMYSVNYKNISGETLSNATLNILLPVGTTFKQTTQGMLTTNNTVITSLGELQKDASGTINVQVTVNGDVVVGSNLVATVTLSFATPSGAQDSAIANTINTVTAPIVTQQQVGLEGNAFFGTGFFPSTLIGWVILIGLIIIIILIVRHYYGYNKKSTNTVVVGDSHHDSHNSHH